jgi:hypothetical protein
MVKLLQKAITGVHQQDACARQGWLTGATINLRKFRVNVFLEEK